MSGKPPAIDWRTAKVDIRPHKDWWAPGEYLCWCRTCKCGFIGDKRAGTCADCAYKEPGADPLDDFKRDRHEALMSMDEQAIRAFHRKWNNHEMPDNPIVFWGSIHKAITGATDLPIEHRRKSKAWLNEHGLKSLYDGDL